MGSEDQRTIPTIILPTLPLYMVALHKMARLGKANVYSQSKRLLQFDMSYHSGFLAKWPELANVARITLIYNDRRNLGL